MLEHLRRAHHAVIYGIEARRASNKELDAAGKGFDEAGKEAGEFGKGIDGAGKSTDELGDSLSDAEKNLRDTGKETDALGDEMDETGKKTSVFGDVLKATLAADLIKAGAKSLLDMVKEVGAAVKEYVSEGSRMAS